MSNCKFCNIINNSKKEDRLENTILFENSNFLVMPSLGSITEGYLMIITKKHINSMAELSKEEMIDLLSLLEKLKKTLYNHYGITPIIFEHGSGKKNVENASSSIIHAHIHIVPINFCKQSHVDIITESKMSKIDIINELYNFGNTSYILYIDQNNDSYISKSTDVILPSQYMRKKIAIEKGVADLWDWREHNLQNNIINTIKKIRL